MLSREPDLSQEGHDDRVREDSLGYRKALRIHDVFRSRRKESVVVGFRDMDHDVARERFDIPVDDVLDVEGIEQNQGSEAVLQ